MILDLKTIIFLTAVTSAVMSLSMFITSANYPHIRGIRKWAWACGAHGLGWFLMYLRGGIHDFFSIVVANTLIAISAMLFYQAITDFKERRSRHRIFYPVLACFFLSFIFFTFVQPSFFTRSIITSAVGSAITFFCAYQLLAAENTKPTLSEWVMGIGFLSVAVTAFIRIVDMIYDSFDSELFVESGLHSLVFGMIFISILILTFSFALMINDKFMAEILRLATLDSLTEIYNRAAMERMINKEIDRSKRYQLAMSLLLVDLDHFKRVNDNFGHQVGDFALKTLVKSISRELRDHDVLGRFGGEEFTILLPETDLDSSLRVAERVRKIVEETKIDVDRETINITISIGLATLKHSTDDFREIFRRADMGLYQAKQSGRNRVVAIREESLPPVDPREMSSTVADSEPRLKLTAGNPADLRDR